MISQWTAFGFNILGLALEMIGACLLWHCGRNLIGRYLHPRNYDIDKDDLAASEDFFESLNDSVLQRNLTNILKALGQAEKHAGFWIFWGLVLQGIASLISRFS